MKSKGSVRDGRVEAGKAYYAISHAYYHLIFEVVEMLGQQRARIKNARLVVSSRLTWEEFFERGCTRENTTLHIFPAGEVSWFDIFDWEHDIP